VLLERLQAASTLPDLQAWRHRAACVDRCMMEFAPPAPSEARDGCKAGCERRPDEVTAPKKQLALFEENPPLSPFFNGGSF
jgi:hypothetical protein